MAEESPLISPRERAAAAIAAAEEAAREEERARLASPDAQSLQEEKLQAEAASATAPIRQLDPRSLEVPTDEFRSQERAEPERLSPISSGERRLPGKTRSTSRAQSPTPAPFLPSPSAVLKSPTQGSTSKRRYSREDGFLPPFGGVPSRACQWLRVFPVIFLMLLVAFLNVIYVAVRPSHVKARDLYEGCLHSRLWCMCGCDAQQHCMPKLQFDRFPEERLEWMHDEACVELLVFGVLNLFFLLSYWLAVATPAGSIPKTPEWEPHMGVESTVALETKRHGGIRYCKWCSLLKPDRSHHCRVCRQCILKMDHHCPWIFNCVGYGNHKFFFLALGWGVALSLYVAITMLPSVKAALNTEQGSFEKSLMLLFAETLDIFLCALISGFFLFHSYLVLTAQTTIEFCESRFGRLDEEGPQISWSQGLWKNICDALGPEPLLWILPVDNRTGDGVYFRVGKIFYMPPRPSKLGLERSLSAAKRLRGFDPIVDSEA